jgi:aromatic ring-opening dioxygenase LigB subunit
MPLVYACIAPHGGEIVPALAGDKLSLFAPTRKAMRELSRRIGEARPDTVVIASPHNLRLPKHIGVVISENSTGRLAEGKREIRLKAKCDIELAHEVITEAEGRGLQVVGANYGASEGRLSDLAMDWGTLIPLWFFLKKVRPKGKIVIVTPAREIPLDENFSFGAAVADVAERGKKRVAFVASADQAHSHNKDGPYGFSKRAQEYDRMVVDAIRNDSVVSIMKTGPRLVGPAKADSLWQMTMLAGALSIVPMKSELLSYQVPTYYGMICASFDRSPQEVV